MKNPIIIGGDKRSYFLYKLFCYDGYEPLHFGAEKEFEFSKPISEISKKEITDKIVILPTPAVKSDGKIFAPFSREDIDTEVLDNFKNCTFFGGMIKEKLKNKLLEQNRVIDISDSPQFTLYNAFLTAEGAIAVATENSDNSLYKSNILIVGYGRIGKSLSKMLEGYFADITVSARTQKDFDGIVSSGYKYIKTADIATEVQKFDYIFNTVPAEVLKKESIEKCKKECLIIDLASMPGGTDFKECEKNDIKALLALSLPGKYSPYGAAKAIYNEIKDNF